MLQVRVTNERQKIEQTLAEGGLEFGRFPNPLSPRVVIEDRYVSRDQLRVEELPLSQVRLTNLGSPFPLPNGDELQKGQAVELSLPVKLTIGFTTIELLLAGVAADEGDDRGSSQFQTISRPSRRAIVHGSHVSSLASLGAAPTADVLTRWFETLLTIQRSAAGSTAFYEDSARAVVELVGLDRGLFLLRKGDDWEQAASYSPNQRVGPPFSRTVLGQVVAQKRTFYQAPSSLENAASLVKIEALVASPIFDADENVVGVIYGSRDLRSGAAGAGISPLEAQVVQLLAGTASAALARMAKEREAARMRVQFEQFVSPELAQELQRNPALLEGTERELTVLFADLRGFSKISEQLGPRDTFRLAGDVMDRLTDSIISHAGVIIDYYGDGLAAMWNAPEEQSDHTILACRAAIAMQGALPQLNETWGALVGSPLRFGVGIHVGPALVGNAGSSRRMKYGPRGHTVNLTSRIEGVTKQLGVSILLSGAARSKLDASWTARRLCSIRAVGVAGVVDVCELAVPQNDTTWQSIAAQYEKALALFESGKPAEALPILDAILNSPAPPTPDGPSKVLRDRCAAAIARPQTPFDPVWQMDAK